VEVTVLPQVDISDAGSAIYLCNVNGLISLDANTPLNGTGKWIQKSGPAAVFEDINDPKTKVTITQLGDYTFEWEISNGICPPSSSQVKIHNYPSLSNTIAAVSSTYCFGQQAQVSGSVPTGGNGIYTYTWETSINGNVWSVLPNETNKDLSFTASETIYVRRTVTAGPCTLTSSSILITVLPPIINNTISEDQEVCIGKSIQQLSGSVPSGGNETFSYQWQQSADGISWQNITGALSQDYTPLTLSSNYNYHILVSYHICTDDPQYYCNMIT